MKILYITLALIFSSLLLSAQTLGVEELNEIRTGFVPDDRTVALQNILTNDNDIRNNTRNWSALGKVDHFFKYKVEVKGITDQQSSGRCWMFTSMNALRPDVMKMLNIDSFDFSHNFNYFWDLLEKSNLFLENIIATVKKDMDDREVVYFFSTPVNDGGVWNLFYNVAEKYGVVPQSVMPESEHSNNTYQLISVVNE
ncbi:MAG: C1 family peptidase, partial [Bacteroidales bacterium]